MTEAFIETPEPADLPGEDRHVCHACGTDQKTDTADGFTIAPMIAIVADGTSGTTLLVNGHHYQYMLCEGCFVDRMEDLHVPPEVFDMDNEAGDSVSWSDDRAMVRKKREALARYERLMQEAEEDRTCVHGLRCDGGDACGKPAVMHVAGSGPFCRDHNNDCYVRQVDLRWYDDADRGRNETLGSFLGRAKVALRYLDAVLSVRRVGARPEYDSALMGDRDDWLVLCVSTLLPLLAQPQWVPIAMEELVSVVGGVPSVAKSWVGHRLPLAYPPGDPNATKANDWLVWAKGNGYDEAVACAELRRSARSLWTVGYGSHPEEPDRPPSAE